MNQKKYYTFYSKHQSIYIFNINSYDSIIASLDFYKPTNFLNQIKYLSMLLYLNLLRIAYPLAANQIKDEKEILEIISNLNSNINNLKLSQDCSILISPTREKIIIHYHEKKFKKIGFHNNYQKVKNEANIYNFLQTIDMQNFNVPKISNELDSKDNIYSFDISNKIDLTTNPQNIKDGLIELFLTTKLNRISLEIYISDLEKVLKENKIILQSVFTFLKKIKENHGYKIINLGFAHGDFKKANMVFKNQQILLFDFEESCLNEIPLYDYFNYIVDPLILNHSPVDIRNKLFNTKNVNFYNKYLKKIGDDINFEILLSLYLVNKIIFYRLWGRDDYRNGFISLFECLNEKK